MALMLAVYVVIGIYIVELVLRNQRLSGALLTIMVIGLLGVVVLLYAPVMGAIAQESVAGIFGSRLLILEICIADMENGRGFFRSVQMDLYYSMCLELILDPSW